MESDDEDQVSVSQYRNPGTEIDRPDRLDDPSENPAYEEHSNSEIASTSSLHSPKISLPSELDSESCHAVMDDTLQKEITCSEHSSDDQTLSSSDYESSVSSSYSDSESTDLDTSISVNDSEDEHDIDSCNLTKEEHQAYSLLSCFLRNKFSMTACKDVIRTLKATFPDSEEIANLDYNEMMSQIDLSPVHEVHYCIKCLDIFPEDKDIFQCQSPNCDGLRYKGPLAAQTEKFRQPHQSFVFTDIKSQLVALLETPGKLRL